MSLKNAELTAAVAPAAKLGTEYRRLAYVAALEEVERGFYGQVDAALESQVQAYCTIEQVEAGTAKVMALTERARDSAAATIERAQKSRESARAFPVAAPAPVKIVKAVKPTRAHSRCRGAGCSAMGVAKYGGYCFECNQDA